jgi:branched-chain amino acid transport system permease protein
MRELWSLATPRARTALLVLLAVLVLAAPLADRYVLSVLILVLYFAYLGQAWNLMMGLCGQLSLGHALYVGLGAYTAAALYQHFGVWPWAGMAAAVAVCVAAASVIGWLALRFSISGTYFALLTIAFAEFTRIGFDHFDWVGASGGFFLTVAQQDSVDVLRLRGHPLLFYYLILALTVGAFVLSAALLNSRLGYYFRAIRDNEDAAAACGVNTFRYKLAAVQISAALTALGGVFHAFYYNNLFPEQVFGMGRSIEIILAPIIGGLGTLFGPVLGAGLLTLLSEGVTELLRLAGSELSGLKQIVYGVVLGLSIAFMPHGVWPLLARRLGLGRHSAGGDDGEGGSDRGKGADA